MCAALPSVIAGAGRAVAQAGLSGCACIDGRACAAEGVQAGGMSADSLPGVRQHEFTIAAAVFVGVGIFS